MRRNSVTIMFGNSSDEETRKAFLRSLMALSLMRYPYYNHPVSFHQSVNFSWLYEFKNEDIVEIMKEVNPTISEMFNKCFWRGSGYDCNDMFQPQVTEEGFCYSFNSKTAEFHNMSNSTSTFKKKNGEFETLRNNAAGKTTGVEIFMLTPPEEHRLPYDTFRPAGYSVMVHSPQDYPDSSCNIAVTEKADQVYRIGISVSETEGDSSLMHLDESVRGCKAVENKHFTNDNNCHLKCRTSEIHKMCNCTPYYLQTNSSKIQTCGIQHLDCLSLNNVRLRTSIAPKGIQGFPDWSTPDFMNCDCSQPCSYVTYDSELTISHVVTGKLTFANDPSFAYIDIAYKSPFAVKYIMLAQYDISDVFVSIGGVAGLLLGCSLVSVVEVMYYFGRYVYTLYKFRFPKPYPYLP
ncbi:pickpocket protein 19-like [Lycorma delicatula]|uniref:pickpocket protein 19-like n=1 Tax=Lycorma delicatula TaxID=130591 RepID=UPI003F50E94D